MNRGRLFASIDHIERFAQRDLDKPRPRPTLTAPPAAVAAATRRPLRTEPPTIVKAAPKAALPHGPKAGSAPAPKAGTVTLPAKAIKVSVVLDPATLAAIELPPGAPAPPFVIATPGRRIEAQVSAKTLRKALTAIAEHGPEQVAVILQGKLATGDTIAEAGLATTVKGPGREG